MILLNMEIHLRVNPRHQINQHAGLPGVFEKSFTIELVEGFFFCETHQILK
jgi:hypothetical protein